MDSPLPPCPKCDGELALAVWVDDLDSVSVAAAGGVILAATGRLDRADLVCPNGCKLEHPARALRVTGMSATDDGVMLARLESRP